MYFDYLCGMSLVIETTGLNEIQILDYKNNNIKVI